MRAWDYHENDTPTSPRAILHHTDPKGPNISGGSVSYVKILLIVKFLYVILLFILDIN